MARPKAHVKDDVVKCSECGYTYQIAIDNQRAWCTGKRDKNTIAHNKAVRMK